MAASGSHLSYDQALSELLVSLFMLSLRPLKVEKYKNQWHYKQEL